MARRWDPKAEMALLSGVGFFGVAWFQRKGGASYSYPNAPRVRSRNAVYAKARRLFGEGGLTRGVFTLYGLAQKTGYSETQICRAMEALNQKWKRLGPRGRHLITDEQAEEITDWLQHDYWAKRLHLYSCVWCSRSDQPHRGAGLCTRCFYRHRRLCQILSLPTTVAEQLAYIQKSLDAGCPDGAQCLDDAAYRLRTGKALSRQQLEFLALYGV